MKQFSIALLVCGTLVGFQARPYEVDTHREMTRQAFVRSSVGSFLDRLGLNFGSVFPFDRPNQALPPVDPVSVVDLVTGGAAEEDSIIGLRSLKHFFDPEHDRGLTFAGNNVGAKSPDWALEDAEGGTKAFQEYSFRDAREAFFAGLTHESREERDVELGQMFRALGQVVHHLQDMAQPQHVRNDAHCGPYCLFIYPSSYFESWALDQPTKVVSTRLPFPDSTYPLQNAGATVFSSARSMWLNAGKGIAEFTNQNFVSAGTNFDKLLDPRVPAGEKYPKPAFNPSAATVQVTSVCEGCPPGVKGKIVFYPITVEDKVTGASTQVLEGSTESIFDERLRFRGMTPAFSLNSFNHSASFDILAPRAIAYSTGMLNYFFRGDIAMEPDADAPGSWAIVNNGPDALSGTFALYYDFDGPSHGPGSRRKHVEWQLNIPSGGRSSVGAIPFPVSPVPSTLGEFMLVFNGTMGSEGLGSSAVGAVAGRKVNLGPVIVFAALRDDDPDSDGLIALNLFVPASMTEAIKLNPSALSVKIGQSEVSTTSSQLIAPCMTFLPGQCLANFGEGTFPLEWDTVLTRGNEFVVRSQTPVQVLAGGNKPEDLDLIPNQVLCGNTIESALLEIIGYPVGVSIPIKVSFAGRTLFELTVSPQAADFSVTLSDTKNVALTANRCRVSIQ